SLSLPFLPVPGLRFVSVDTSLAGAEAGIGFFASTRKRWIRADLDLLARSKLSHRCFYRFGQLDDDHQCDQHRFHDLFPRPRSGELLPEILSSGGAVTAGELA